jgi:hypothetical protein
VTPNASHANALIYSVASDNTIPTLKDHTYTATLSVLMCNGATDGAEKLYIQLVDHICYDVRLSVEHLGFVRKDNLTVVEREPIISFS